MARDDGTVAVCNELGHELAERLLSKEDCAPWGCLCCRYYGGQYLFLSLGALVLHTCLVVFALRLSALYIKYQSSGLQTRPYRCVAERALNFGTNSR